VIANAVCNIPLSAANNIDPGLVGGIVGTVTTNLITFMYKLQNIIVHEIII